MTLGQTWLNPFANTSLSLVANLAVILTVVHVHSNPFRMVAVCTTVMASCSSMSPDLSLTSNYMPTVLSKLSTWSLCYFHSKNHQKSIVVYHIAAQSHVFLVLSSIWCSWWLHIYLSSVLSSLFSLLILSLLFVFRCHRIDNAMYNYYITSHSFIAINTRLLILRSFWWRTKHSQKFVTK